MLLESVEILLGFAGSCSCCCESIGCRCSCRESSSAGSRPRVVRESFNLHISITWYLFSLLVALVRHLSSPSVVHPHLPHSKSQIALSVMHYPVFRIIYLPHSVNLVHHLSPPSHHPSLPLSSIPDLKLTCSTNPSHHRSSLTHRTAHWTSTGLPSRTPYHSALCFSSFVIFF